jgi:hypothetical protein
VGELLQFHSNGDGVRHSLKNPLKLTRFSSDFPMKLGGGEGRNRPFSVVFAYQFFLILQAIQDYSLLSVLIGFYSFGVRFGVR